jgi:hypothetical protein
VRAVGVPLHPKDFSIDMGVRECLVEYVYPSRICVCLGGSMNTLWSMYAPWRLNVCLRDLVCALWSMYVP